MRDQRLMVRFAFVFVLSNSPDIHCSLLWDTCEGLRVTKDEYGQMGY